MTSRAQDVAIYLSHHFHAVWDQFGFFDLHRLLYLAQGWHIASGRGLLFDGTITAHRSAPLSGSVKGLVPLEEMLAIDGFDETIAEELRARAIDALLTQALASEERIEGVAPAEDLLGMEGMDEALAINLASRGIVTMEDLAEQSIDDLLDIEGVDATRAAALIMKAREPWFA